MKRIAILASIAIGILFLTVPAHSATCSIATLKGAYGYQDTYQDSAGKWYIAGLLTFDGNGKGTTNWTLRGEDGTVVQDPVGIVISYAVAPNCTFIFTHDPILNNGLTFSGVIVNNAKELRYVESTGAQFRIGQAVKVSSQNEQ